MPDSVPEGLWEEESGGVLDMVLDNVLDGLLSSVLDGLLDSVLDGIVDRDRDWVILWVRLSALEGEGVSVRDFVFVGEDSGSSSMFMTVMLAVLCREVVRGTARGWGTRGPGIRGWHHGDPCPPDAGHLAFQPKNLNWRHGFLGTSQIAAGGRGAV